jgi:hypothetical protein
MANFVWNSTTKQMSVTLAQQLADPELAVDIIGTSEAITGPILTTPTATRYQTVADLSYKPVLYFPSNDGTRNLVFGNAKSKPIQFLEIKNNGVYISLKLNYTFVDLIPLVSNANLEPKLFRDSGLRDMLSRMSLKVPYGSIDAPTIAVAQSLKTSMDSAFSLKLIKPTLNVAYSSIEAPTIAVSQELKISKTDSFKDLLNKAALKISYGTIEAPTIAVSQDLTISKIYTPVVYKTLPVTSASLGFEATVNETSMIEQPLIVTKLKFIKGDYQHLSSSSSEYMETKIEQLYIANKKLTRNPQKDTRGQFGLRINFDYEIGSFTQYMQAVRSDRSILLDHEVKQEFYGFNPKKIKYFTKYESVISPTNVNGGLRDIQVLLAPVPAPQKIR